MRVARLCPLSTPPAAWVFHVTVMGVCSCKVIPSMVNPLISWRQAKPRQQPASSSVAVSGATVLDLFVQRCDEIVVTCHLSGEKLLCMPSNEPHSNNHRLPCREQE